VRFDSWKLVILAVVIAGVLGGCEKDDSKEVTNPGIPPSNSIATILTGRTEIMAGDTTRVTAWVVDPDGEPVEGATVGFVTTWGNLTSVEAVADAEGKVSTVLATPISYLEVQAEVRASTAGRVKYTIVDVAPFIEEPGSEEVAQLAVSMTPASLRADGLSTATIEVAASDAAGDPVEGATIRLAAGERFQDVDGDGVFSDGTDVLLEDTNANDEWDAAGTLASWVTTGADGTAETTMQVGVIAGDFVVKATAGNVSDEFEFTLDGLPSITFLALEAERGEIQVEGTGGTEAVEIQGLGLDQDGNPVPSGLPVTFRILQGPGGGESIEDLGYGPVTVLTEDDGIARVMLRSGTVSGTVVVQAAAGAVLSSATRVAIAAGPPHYIDAGMDPVNIRGWDMIGVPAKVTAIVSDVYENPVRDGTVVYFTTEEGTVTPSSGTVGGFALATFYSGAPRNDGIAHITASTSGGTLTTETAVITSGPPASVTILSAPAELNADGRSKGWVVVRVLDVNDNFVVAGTVVKFEASLGNIDAQAVTNDGWYDSIAEARLYSTILELDASVRTPDDGLGGIALVEAKAGLGGAVSASTTVDFLTTSASAGKSSTTLPTSADIGESVPFDLTVKDYWGNPLGGHLWSFSVVSGGGSVTAAGTSNRFGVVSGLTFTAPPSPAKVTIQAVDQDPLYGDGIVISKTIDIQ
jgi:hypothetical protein